MCTDLDYAALLATTPAPVFWALKSALCPRWLQAHVPPSTLQIHYLSEKKPCRTQVRPGPHLKSPLMGVVGPAVVLMTQRLPGVTDMACICVFAHSVQPSS